jgi:hypothetical protein
MAHYGQITSQAGSKPAGDFADSIRPFLEAQWGLLYLADRGQEARQER